MSYGSVKAIKKQRSHLWRNEMVNFLPSLWKPSSAKLNNCLSNLTDKLLKLMFYVLRFYLESKIPQALSSYKQKFYGWTTAPTQALAFATKVGAEAAVSDIRQYSKLISI